MNSEGIYEWLCCEKRKFWGGLALSIDIHYIGSRILADDTGQVMNRQRVLYLTASAGTYGAENALFDLIRSLPKEIEPIVLVPEPGPLVDSLTGLGIQCRIVPFTILDRKYFHPFRILVYKASALLSTLRLLKVFRQLEPALIHTNNVLILPGAFSAKMLGIPHVWHIREVIEGHHIHPLLWNIWRWIILTFSARVICISSAVQKQFGDNKKTVVIHDGIDTALFSPSRNRSARFPKKKEFAIGIVGRLEHRRKGQDLFIEAARIALQSRKDLRFVIVGHERDGIGDREQKLQEMVRRHGLGEKIEFRGFVKREDMPKLMNELDVLVLCSKQPEGLGVVLLEAMACEKVVISFAEGGPLDVIKDHVNGLLVPPQNVQKLAEAILEVAGNHKLRKSLGVEGRKTVESSFRTELTAREIVRVYKQIRK